MGKDSSVGDKKGCLVGSARKVVKMWEGVRISVTLLKWPSSGFVSA